MPAALARVLRRTDADATFRYSNVISTVYWRSGLHDTTDSPSDAAAFERKPLRVNQGPHAPAAPPASHDPDADPGYDAGSPWQDYPLDDILIRQEHRTIHDVVRRIRKRFYVMDPDFQRDFIWKADKQSKLIESVILRIPLPVFYLAEDNNGRMIVVDGLQRLSTFDAFLNNELPLRSLDRDELNGKRFSDLSFKLQNRIEDSNLILYTIDSRVPDRAKLDIFERVNSGVPLSRQQMRNCLYVGNGTRFLKDQAQSELFKKATGRSLKPDMMRDREFVNRFCAFSILDLKDYRGDMDGFLATALQHMNQMDQAQLSALAEDLHRGLVNNYVTFRQHAFRRHAPNQEWRSVLNASLWDVMCTGLSRYSETRVREHEDRLRKTIQGLLADDDFIDSIARSTSATKMVMHRFKATDKALTEVLG